MLILYIAQLRFYFVLPESGSRSAAKARIGMGLQPRWHRAGDASDQWGVWGWGCEADPSSTRHCHTCSLPPHWSLPWKRSTVEQSTYTAIFPSFQATQLCIIISHWKKFYCNWKEFGCTLTYGTPYRCTRKNFWCWRHSTKHLAPTFDLWQNQKQCDYHVKRCDTCVQSCENNSVYRSSSNLHNIKQKLLCWWYVYKLSVIIRDQSTSGCGQVVIGSGWSHSGTCEKR